MRSCVLFNMALSRFLSFVFLFLLLPCLQAAPKVENVLFLIADDLKASVLGCYGDRFCKTPGIDRLAAQGLVFDRAYSQGTACGPSRLSLMHSRYEAKATGPNMGSFFRKKDWYVARVGKIYHMRVPGDIIAGTDGADVPSSWTERFNSSGQEAHTPGDYACLNLNVFTTELEGRQSTRMPHRMFVEVRYEGDGSDQPDHRTATKTIELLREHREGPFFIAAGFVRPHYPMVAPRQYFEAYPWEDMELPKVPDGDLDDIPKLGIASTRNATNPIGQYPDNQKRMWSAYYASTTFMDEQVGRVLDELDHLGLRESTAVVFTSDHGYHLGEHTFWQKSNLHEEVLRVPLIISSPGRKAGRTKSLVELADLWPTLAELAGHQAPAGVDGKSFAGILEDHSATIRDTAFSSHAGRNYSLRGKRWHYMRYRDGAEELYDMEKDPGEIINLARLPESAPILEAQRIALDERLSDAGLPRKK